MGSAAAGAAAVLGVIVVDEATRGGRRRAGSFLEDFSVPQLQSAPSAATEGAAQVFRSRPDLRPPTITVDVRSNRSGQTSVLTDSHAGPAQQGPDDHRRQWRPGLVPPAVRRVATPGRGHSTCSVDVQGQQVLGWFQGAVVEAHGQGHYELFDSSYNKVGQVHAKNGYQGDLHEFVMTPEGTALFTCYGQAPANLSRFGGLSHGSYFYGVVQEVDAEHGQAGVRVAQRPARWPRRVLLKPVDPQSTWDYFHINSIDVDPTDGNLIISGRNTWAFYKVDRSHRQDHMAAGRQERATSSSGRAPSSLSSTTCGATLTARSRCSTTKEGRRRGSPSREASCWQWTRSRARPPGPAVLAFTARAVRGARAASRTSDGGNRFVGWGSRVISPSTTPRAMRCLRRSPSVRDRVLPRLQTSLDGRPVRAAGDRRRLREQWGHRVRQLERGDGGGRLARPRGPHHRISSSPWAAHGVAVSKPPSRCPALRTSLQLKPSNASWQRSSLALQLNGAATEGEPEASPERGQCGPVR